MTLACARVCFVNLGFGLAPRSALKFLSLAVLSFCILLATPLAHAQSIPCVLKIVQLETGGGTPFYVRCPGGPGVCRGNFALAIEGAKQAIFVKAFCEPGRVTLAFADMSGTLALGSQTFTVIHMPQSNTAHASLDLYPPLARLSQDSPPSHIDLPVLRQSDRPIAKVRVDVWTER